jgi:hypothetical protein
VLEVQRFDHSWPGRFCRHRSGTLSGTESETMLAIWWSQHQPMTEISEQEKRYIELSLNWTKEFYNLYEATFVVLATHFVHVLLLASLEILDLKLPVRYFNHMIIHETQLRTAIFWYITCNLSELFMTFSKLFDNREHSEHERNSDVMRTMQTVSASVFVFRILKPVTKAPGI